MPIEVSKIKLGQLCESAQVMTLSEDKVTKTVFHEKVELVVTGTSSSGNEGWISCWAMRVVDLQNYKGRLKPLRYYDRSEEVDKGKRERGYSGALVDFGERKLVLYGEQITFISSKSEEGKQETLF